MSIKYNPITLVSAASAVTGAWVPLDFKFKSIQQRVVVATQDANSVSAGDVLQLQVTPDGFTTTASISTIVTVTSFTTATYSGVLNGPWTAIRAVKTGAGGTGLVKIVG